MLGTMFEGLVSNIGNDRAFVFARRDEFVRVKREYSTAFCIGLCAERRLRIEMSLK